MSTSRQVLYKYKFKYLHLKYKYEYKYFKLYSSTSTKYYISDNLL